MSDELKKLYNDLSKQTEEALKNSEKNHRLLLQNLPGGVVIHAADSSILFANDQASLMLGLSQDQLLGKVAIDPAWHFIREDLTPMPHDQYPVQYVIANKIPLLEQVLGIHHPKTNDIVWVMVNAFPEFETDGFLQQVVVTFVNITERKKAEEAARVSEENFRFQFLNMNSYNSLYEVITDKKGKPYDFRFVMVNNAYEEYVGKKASELIGKTLLEVYPDTEQFWIDKMAEAVFSKVPIHFDSFSRVMNTHTEISLFVPKPGLLAMTTGNITERKRAEDALNESETHFRTLADSGQAIIWTSGLDKKCDYFNQPWLTFTGRTLEQELGDGWVEGLHPDDLARCIEIYVSSFDRREKFSMDYRIRHFSGEYRWIQDDGSPRYNSKGEFIGYIGHCLDISTRKQVEKELLKTTERLALATSSGQLGVWDWNLMDNSMTWDDRMFEIYGITRTTFSNTIDAWTNGLHPEDKKRALDECNEALAGTKEFRTTFRVLRPDGTIVYVKADGLVTRDQDGKAMRMVGINSDITNYKQMEEKIREKDIQFRKLSANVPDLIFQFTRRPDGTYHVPIASEGIINIFGCTPEDVLDDFAPIARVIYPDDAARVISDIEYSAKHLTFFTCEFRVQIPGKAIQWIYSRSTPEKFPDGSVTWFGFNANITERKRMEEELQKTQKLESLGVMAGGIAHDFNNLLGSIFGYIELAKLETTEEGVANNLTKSLNSIGRARALTQQLLTFAKGGAPVKKTESLFPFIQETAQFALSGSTVSCKFHIPADLWLCDFDKNQIGQVIDNLIINAQQAMPNGGTIEVYAQNIVISAEDTFALATGNYVKLSIKDQGIGIPKEFLHSIFDPYFTTKSKGQGLGLATCFSIISRHGGCIDVESEPGKGSTFHVYLPATLEPVSDDTKNLTGNHSGKGIFLMMDDDEDMRLLAKKSLESFGYTVVLKENGRDALDYFYREHQAHRKLAGMIFDLTIPGGMGGKETIAEIRKIDSDTPAFVASGYSEDPIMANPELYGFNGSLCKPFMKQDLSDMLEEYMRKKER